MYFWPPYAEAFFVTLPVGFPVWAPVVGTERTKWRTVEARRSILCESTDTERKPRGHPSLPSLVFNALQNEKGSGSFFIARAVQANTMCSRPTWWASAQNVR